VTLSGDAGTRTLRVTGLGFTVEGYGPDEDHGDGAWVTASGYHALFGTFVLRSALFALHPGSSPAAAIPRLQQASTATPGAQAAVVIPQAPPQRFGQIQRVRVLPVLLAGSWRCLPWVRSGTRWPPRCASGNTTWPCYARWG